MSEQYKAFTIEEGPGELFAVYCGDHALPSDWWDGLFTSAEKARAAVDVYVEQQVALAFRRESEDAQ